MYPRCISLTKVIPLRRHLVPTPSTKGGAGGVERTPSYDLENGKFYKLQLCRPLGLSMRGKKPVELMI